MTTILVLGKTGQLARSIADITQDTRADFIFADRKMADFLSPQSTLDYIKAVAPDVIINAVAYTAVDTAEEDQETAFAVNTKMPGEIGKLCAKHDIFLIHFSTDCVFDGKSINPYTEECITNPINYYGISKRDGELTILDSGCKAIIIRTSWVFSPYGKNFLAMMLRLAKERDRLDIVADQIGQPTAASDLAKLAVELSDRVSNATPPPSGIYHFSGHGVISRADFAREIFKQADLQVNVQDIPTSAYPAAAARPTNAVLACEKILHDLNIEAPDWRQELKRTLTILSK